MKAFQNDRSAWQRYLAAIVIVAVAVGVRIAFLKVMGIRVPYLTLYPAVIAAAVCGGLGPGVLATALSAIAAGYLWFEPMGAFDFNNSIIWLGEALFVASGIFISSICEKMHRAVAALRLREADLEELVAVRTAAFEKASTLLDALISEAPIGFAFLDRDLRFRLVNRQLALISGIDPAAHLGRRISEIDPVLGQSAEEITRRILETGEAVRNREFSGEAGVKGVWNGSWFPVRGSGGELLGFGAVVEEITERKRVEEVLRASEENARHQWGQTEAALEAVPASIAILDENGFIIRVNEAWNRFAFANSSTPAGLAVGANYLAVCDSAVGEEREAAAAFAAGIRRVLGRGCETFSFEYPCHSPASKRWFSAHVTASPARGLLRVVIAHVDITEHKLAQERLSASSARLKLALDSARMGAWDWDVQSGALLWTPLHEVLFGFEPGEPSRKHGDFLERVHPEDLVCVKAAVQASMESGADFTSEFRVFWPDGSLHWISAFGRFHYDEQKRPARMLGTLIEITEQKQAGAALHESNARFRSIFHQAATAMSVTSPDGRFLKVNRAYCELLGYSEAELMATTFAALTHPEDRESTEAYASRRLVGKELPIYRTETRYLHKLGHVIWVGVSVSAVHDLHGAVDYFIAQIHDISARKSAEEAVLKLNAELERRVIERTVELSAAVNALETEMAERRRLERELLEISEREQCRFGMDLHDGLSQELAGVAFLSQALANKLRMESHSLAASAFEIATFTSNTIETARSLAKGLYPVELQRYGLLIAMEDLAIQTGRRFKVECTFEKTGPHPFIPASSKIQLYRIAQECIANAVKHGKAQHIAIESRNEDGIYTLSVADDGVGFETPGPGNTGMGLHLMNYRAHMVGAVVEVQRPEEGGCTVVCRLPAEVIEAS